MSEKIRSLAVLEVDESGNKKYGTPIPLSVHIEDVDVESELKAELAKSGIVLSTDSLDVLLKVLASGLHEHKESIVDSKDGAHGIRYNSEDEVLEVYNGEDWISAGGGSGNANVFNGTMEEYETAYAAGEVKDDSIVNIIGDYNSDDDKVDADTLAGHTADAFALKNHTHNYVNLEGKPVVDGVLVEYPLSGKSLRNIFVSTDKPTSSDGDNGDLWITYEA
jgi:hypothetical protein